MGRSAVSNQHMKNKFLECPRDHSSLVMQDIKDAALDVCNKCGGQFFDAGEMFGAFGIKADGSYWDRAETASAMKDSDIHCPRCEHMMLLQEIKHGAHKVDIDRCRSCGGIWLDKGEVETLMKIGEAMQPIVDAELAKAKEDLAKMGEVDFSGGLISRFLKMFKKG